MTPRINLHPASAAPEPSKVTLMPNEKVLFSHEIDAMRGFRILATGTFNADMAAALKSFADFMGTLHKAPAAPAAPPPAAEEDDSLM